VKACSKQRISACSENYRLGRMSRMRERVTLDIRAEFVSAFNRTEMNNPISTNTAATQTTSSYGQTTAGLAGSTQRRLRLPRAPAPSSSAFSSNAISLIGVPRRTSDGSRRELLGAGCTVPGLPDQPRKVYTGHDTFGDKRDHLTSHQTKSSLRSGWSNLGSWELLPLQSYLCVISMGQDRRSA